MQFMKFAVCLVFSVTSVSLCRPYHNRGISDTIVPI